MTNNHYLIPNWPAPKNIKAFVTTRVNGHSKPPYNSFNLSNGIGDDPALVNANRQQLREELQLKNEPCWLNQVHGINVVCIDDPAQKGAKADAAFATQANNVCVISTADCLPIFLCDKQGKKVAAIHAGWRSLCHGVIEATVKALQTPGEEILAWLGPAIGPAKFEVGAEVRAEFLALDKQAEKAFIPALNESKWLGNLYQLAKQRLANSGVIAVYGGNDCTYTDKERFFSYRRDAGKTGRMASLIWTEPRL